MTCKGFSYISKGIDRVSIEIDCFLIIIQAILMDFYANLERCRPVICYHAALQKSIAQNVCKASVYVYG
jgi:hypothetical protein